MRISEQWLREWVDPSVSTEELGVQLTMAGHELASIEPAAPAFEGVVVAEVLDAQPHPNADRLRLCQVSTGDGDPVEVVCGAPNAVAGMRAAFAQTGARLPGNFKIRRSKIRGVVSNGMLCSATELGLGEESDGIIALPADAPVGQDVREYLALDDSIIEVDLTPNRGDCLCVSGIAREVGVVNSVDRTARTIALVPVRIDDALPVTLDAPAGCPVYAGRAVRGIRPDAKTPFWICERLRRCGLRPIHPVVDVTNYVMLEFGQPMHGFDLTRLTGGIVVRQAKDGESLVLLDGREVALEPDMLVIADHAGAVALAGIMGGDKTAVTDETTDVFFESAFFAPLAIAGRARRLGMHTDASHRFERGVDPEGQLRALERATALLIEIAGGQAGPLCVGRDGAHVPARSAIHLRRSRLDRVLGVSVPDEQVTDTLRRLELDVEQTVEGWRAQPPSFRFDLEIEDDLVEEVGRIYGFDRVPETPEAGVLVARGHSERRVAEERTKGLLVDRGYAEAITYSFVEPGQQALFVPGQDALELENPISSDLSVMRLSLWPGLMSALRQNASRQRGRVRLFELGLRYTPEGDGFKEEKLIAGVISGDALPEQWGASVRPADFYDIKGDVEALLALSGQSGHTSFEVAQHPSLHPGQSARVRVNGEMAGWVGAFHPLLLRDLDTAGPVLGFELQLGAVLAAEIPVFEPVSRFPALRRDLAVVVDEAVTAQALEACVRSAASEFLRDLRIFDVYRGKGIDSGRKSVALGLILQGSSRTLTDQDADRAVEAVIESLEQELKARIRD